MRIARWLAGLLVVFLILPAILIGAAVYLPQMNSARQGFADYVLTASFDRYVAINGPVTIALGETIDVTIADIAVESVFSRSVDGPERIDHGAFAIPLASLLRGNPEISRLDLSGADIDVLTAGASEIAQEQKLVEIAEFPASFLTHPIAGDLTLDDVSLRFVDPKAGLDELLVVRNLRSQVSDDAESIEMTADVELNGIAYGWTALIDNPLSSNDRARGAIDIDIALPGSKNSLVGTLDVSGPMAILDGEFDAQFYALGDVLDALRLQRILEGMGNLSAKLTGPLNAITVSEIDGSFEQENGERFTVDGSISDLVQGSGLDLIISAVLHPSEEKAEIEAPIASHRVTGFDGRIAGSFEEMQIDQLTVKTNSFNVELQDIGPVTVDQIAKGPEGKLVFKGIRVLNGPPDQPTLFLEGGIEDALSMSGVRMSGTFDLDTMKILSFKGDESTDELGRFQGEITMSDDDGVFGIDTIAGSIQGSELIKMDLELVVEDLEDLDEITFDVDLDIPDFAAFVSTLGGESKARGGFEFIGHVKIGDDVPTIDGQIIAGQTTLNGQISAQRGQGIPEFSGSIQSDSLTIADLANLWDVNQFLGEQQLDYITVNENALAGFVLDVEVDARKIAEAGKDVGNVAGRIVYSDKDLKLDPLKVSYLGGVIDVASDIDLSTSPPRLKAKGGVKSLPVGKLLAQLGAPAIASGSLNASFDLNGVARRDAFAKTASGSVTLSLWNGNLGTNLIDLTGMDYVSWAFTRGQDDSTKVVCAILPMTLKAGIGNTTKLVVETDNVQLVGKGLVDLKNDKLDLTFQPISKNRNTISVATPFSISGPLTKPDINLQRQGAGLRAATEILSVPMNIFANLMGTNRQGEAGWQGEPCIVPVAENK